MTAQALRALVVDDEPVARRRLLRMLQRLEAVEAVGEAGDGAEALERIRTLEPDVILLDIRMPGMDGLTLAKGSAALPPIVFTTAYDEHALEAFEAAAVDYLLKPVDEQRLQQALERVRTRLRGEQAQHLVPLLRELAGEARPPRIAARHGPTTRLFDPREIPAFRARDKYSSFRHGDRWYLLEESLVSLQRRLAPWGFQLVHRSALVDVGAIEALRDTGRGWVAELAGGEKVPVSRRRLAALERRLGLRT